MCFRLDSFLCCMRLETGGYIIAAIGILEYVLILFLGISLVTLGAATTNEGCVDFFKDMDNIYLSSFNVTDEVELNVTTRTLGNEDCEFGRTMFMVFGGIIVIFAAIALLTNILMVVGIKKRKHGFILPALICITISVLVTLRHFAGFHIERIISGLLEIILVYYCFLVIYSLYVKFRDQPRQTVPVQYQHQMTPMYNQKANV